MSERKELTLLIGVAVSRCTNEVCETIHVSVPRFTGITVNDAARVIIEYSSDLEEIARTIAEDISSDMQRQVEVINHAC